MLMQNVDRETQAKKVNGLMQAAPALIDEMHHNYMLDNMPIKVTPIFLMKLKDASTIVGAMISGTQLIFLQRDNHNKDIKENKVLSKIITILGLIQGTSSFVLIICYIINKYALVTK
jgi:prenyltransferase beta subunit